MSLESSECCVLYQSLHPLPSCMYSMMCICSVIYNKYVIRTLTQNQSRKQFKHIILQFVFTLLYTYFEYLNKRSRASPVLPSNKVFLTILKKRKLHLIQTGRNFSFGSTMMKVAFYAKTLEIVNKRRIIGLNQKL